MYRQKNTEKKLLFEERTTEYSSGIGLDIGNQTNTGTVTKTKTCKCGLSTHKTIRHKQFPLNKSNILSDTNAINSLTMCQVVQKSGNKIDTVSI